MKLSKSFGRSKKGSRIITYAAICLALALLLPFLTGQIPTIGQALSPMHLPTLLCGYICGPLWGLAVGFVAPLLRSQLFAMPPLAAAIPMAFELAAYGFVSGMIYRRVPHKMPFIYLSLIIAMLSGRIVWGTVKWLMAVYSSDSFGFAAFLAGAVTGSIPGSICQLVLLPSMLVTLKKAGFIDP